VFRLPTSQLQELRDRLQSRGARPSILLTTEADRALVEAVAVVEAACRERAIRMLGGDPVRQRSVTPEEQELLERLADAFQMDERHATALLDELHQQAG
jgi:hypothetical protein